MTKPAPAKTGKIYLALFLWTLLVSIGTTPLEPRAAEMIQNVWTFAAFYVIVTASIAPLRAHMSKYYPPTK